MRVYGVLVLALLGVVWAGRSLADEVKATPDARRQILSKLSSIGEGRAWRSGALLTRQRC